MRSVAFHTLGCKVNQYDTQAMIEALAKDCRIVSNKERADIYIINTCTVTNRADQKSRQQIRNVIRKNPEAFIAVTGCYAQRFPQRIAEIQGVDLILGNREKNRFQGDRLNRYSFRLLGRGSKQWLHSCAALKEGP